MDHMITIEKLLAMKKFKKNQLYILHKFILYSLAALACTLFCISPSWVSSPSSSIKLFLSVSLPKLGASIFNPKCLFIVCNIIVLFLIGESKFFGSKSPPAATDIIYDIEYVKTTSHEEKKENKMNSCLPLVEINRVVKEREDDSDGEEECFLGAEELNKRVESFIARVKKQRKLETPCNLS